MNWFCKNIQYLSGFCNGYLRVQSLVYMRLLHLPLLILLSILISTPLASQVSVEALQLPYGKYTVGYRHDVLLDSTRTYQRSGDWTNEFSARPIPVSIWYPAKLNLADAEPLRVFDYLKVLRDEEECEHLPDSLIMDWFEFPGTPANRLRVQETTRAVRAAERASGTFPVVIYAASFLAASTENFALCEMLASQGYLVLAIPGRGAGARPMLGSAARNAEAQARDLEFIIAEVRQMPGADPDRISLMDYSFGGLATTMVALRNENVKALVSLDGRSRYDYETIYASPTVQGLTLDVPFLHAAQKIIPDQVLKEDGIDPELNTEFRLFDSLRRVEVYALRFHDLSHRHFSTMGLLLKNRDARQDKTDEQAMVAHRWLTRCVLTFLDEHLRGRTNGMHDLLASATKGEWLGEHLSVNRKAAQNSVPTFREFNDLARKNAYRSVDSLYARFGQQDQSFHVPEWQLNTLGLNLGFDPVTAGEAIRVYRFALSLYPASANLWDSLGLVQQVNGDKAGAVESYKKSLDLNPDNGHAKMRLGQLE